MASAAVSTFGTSLSRAGTVIAEINNIKPPKLSVGDIDITNHQSPNGYKEYIPGIREGGEVGIEGNFIASDANGQVALMTDFNANTKSSYVLTFPDGTTWTFTAYVKDFQCADAKVEDKLAFTATLKVSGKPVLGINNAPALTGLVVTTGTLVPSFAGTTYDYVAIIATDQTSVTITPTCATADSIEVDGNTVATGVPSSAITLGAAGSVTEVDVVTKKAGYADRTYTIRLTREAS